MYTESTYSKNLSRDTIPLSCVLTKPRLPQNEVLSLRTNENKTRHFSLNFMSTAQKIVVTEFCLVGLSHDLKPNFVR
jgi:hypothetical protein